MYAVHTQMYIVHVYVYLEDEQHTVPCWYNNLNSEPIMNVPCSSAGISGFEVEATCTAPISSLIELCRLVVPASVMLVLNIDL